MFTPPDDLAEPDLPAALAAGWSLRASRLEYRAVGFGSHHWVLGDGHFVTVDDLRTLRRVAGEPLDAAYRRQRSALAAAIALRAAGRDFVVAPLPAHDGSPVVRLGESFAVAVYPLVTGESFDWDNFTPSHRRAVLDMLVGVHTAPPSVLRHALTDDYVVQFRDVLDGVGGGDHGPYSQRADRLIDEHGPGVRRALARYDDLVSGVRADPPGLVLTHGEPHPGNTMRTADGWVLIDWDGALVAPRERDLAGLDDLLPDDIVVRAEVLELYRLRWDLTEIGSCLVRFRAPHGDTADDEETWTNLVETVERVTG